jgi:type I restriction enzyme R subunit
MLTTNIREAGLETLIVSALTGVDGGPACSGRMKDSAAPYAPAGYVLGDPADYDREHAVDLAKLLAFLQATQPRAIEALGLAEDGPRRRQFLARLQGEVARRGVIDVLRKGVKHGPVSVSLFYGTPSPGNTLAQERYRANVFSVTRQLRYSRDETQRALDLCLFINGLPVITFELKNRLTVQNAADAVRQYQRDRDPREPLFAFGRCMVHLAVDEDEVWMCAHLQGKDSWFLPFNKGWNDGAGNPPNPRGLKTDYLWREVLTREGLTDVLENYAQIVEERDAQNKKKRKQIFPRYHQLDVVRRIVVDVRHHGAGRRYLIQHSAGSGKSNSIAWLAHQLVGLERDGAAVFDSIVVVTDRRILDRQIRDTIKQFAQVSSLVGHAEHSGDLRRFLEAGKKIIITTIQKFPIILDDISNDHRGRTFAIIIDEAHSSQGGRTSAKMSMVLAEQEEDEEATVEDIINHLMETRRLLPNASYLAFTATPKNKTLELFGEAYEEGGEVKHRPFHCYTMKQAIQEGFILDVLSSYTPVKSYFRLIKTVEDDPEFDARRAQKRMRRYVEEHGHAIGEKAEIMIDHFHDQVLARRKIGGQARAMVVTGSIRRAIEYYDAFVRILAEKKSPYKALVAFSGEHEYGGRQVTEVTLNGIRSNDIAQRFREDPYRFLIVADKFQTGYDEPLLHTMYVDKVLSGVKAVQTLSRLNRSHPHKRDTFVLDFANDAEMIQQAFEPYYRTTILSGETDPNKLHNLKADLDNHQVYTPEDIEDLVALFLRGAPRERLEPILDRCAAVYREELDEDGQVDFKGKAKAFTRTYAFLASILPYSLAEWEKTSIFLNLLIPKLPAPVEEDLAKGILESIDMESYRTEVQAAIGISLADADGEIGPVPVSGGGQVVPPEMERLSRIIQEFNDLWGSIPWQDKDRLIRVISEEIPARVAADKAYQNARLQGDPSNARIEHDIALQRVIVGMMTDDTELAKRFFDDQDFRRWFSDMVFGLTYSEQVA